MILKLGLLAVLTVLTACATQPNGQTVGQPPEADLRLSHFAFSDQTLANHEATPLGTHDWILRSGEATVPIFDKGTDKREVMSTLRKWRLKPLAGKDSIIVVEGPSRHRFGMAEPSHVIYGFSDDQLTVGPLKESELVDVLVHWGLDSDDFALLATLDLVAPLSADALNNVAWAFATYHEASRRAPGVALILAERANDVSDWQEPVYLDTFAAAFAAAGDFDNAVNFQLEAVLIADGDDQGMIDRLALYEERQPYVEAANAAALSDLQPPPPGLIGRAQGGEAAAQFELATYCLENNIDHCAGNDISGGHWLLQSARQDYVKAIEETAFGFLYGYYGFKRDPEAAHQWLQKGIALGSWLAGYHLAVMYRDNIYLDRNEGEVTRLMRQAASRGMPEAAIETAYRLQEGVGAESDHAAASKLFDTASAAGVGPEQLLYGDPDAYTAQVVNDDAIAALPPLEILPGVFPGHLMDVVDAIEGQLRQGRSFVTARLPHRLMGWSAEDAPEVIHTLTLAAARFGSVRGQRKLAQLYERGSGVGQSASEAAYWRERARNNRCGL